MSNLTPQPEAAQPLSSLQNLALRVSHRLLHAGDSINRAMIAMGTKGGHELKDALGAIANELAGHHNALQDDHRDLAAITLTPVEPVEPEPASETELGGWLAQIASANSGGEALEILREMIRSRGHGGSPTQAGSGSAASATVTGGTSAASVTSASPSPSGETSAPSTVSEASDSPAKAQGSPSSETPTTEPSPSTATPSTPASSAGSSSTPEAGAGPSADATFGG